MKYTIEIWSRGVDVGIGTITKEQYDYWSERESYDLDEALNNNFDYESEETPSEAILDKEYYNEYSDVLYAWGPDMDHHEMVIKDENGTEVYKGDAYDLIHEYDEDYESMYEGEEYFMNVQKPGYYVQWCQGGKGIYFEGEFEADEFDPKKLKFFNSETNYGDVLSKVYYDGEELDNNAGDYDIKSFEASLEHVTEEGTYYSKLQQIRDAVNAIRSSYNYEKIDKVLQHLVDNRWYDVDNLEVGENISDYSEVKIIFDGYGDLEEDENGDYVEGGNKNMESYAVFIHKNSAEPDFEFPEHEMTPWALIHRPDDEICFWAWHDVENDSWDFSMIDDTSSNLSEEVLIKLFDELYEKYNLDAEDEDEDDGDGGGGNTLVPSAAWPFPTERP
jgi:hypothetical protein